MNYIDNNVENLGYEAWECWNCNERTFLPDQGLFRFMDRMGFEEVDALISLHQNTDIIVVDGRSAP
jgi:hypothetical protein